MQSFREANWGNSVLTSPKMWGLFLGTSASSSLPSVLRVKSMH